MASDQIVVINQLASRLENATSTERIYALQELQSHAKVNPDIVGSFSLKKVLDFLQEQGSAEEYQEALDLIYRLVKCRDKVAAASNANIILGDTNAVELLLDLLNHEDLTVGVMTSQILTEIHAANGPSLELQIQQCPDGMNKLLQRLPDSSREEVRNQAIVLIQQLTSTNEEMKKTVVFNEGFEILFGIIQREGGFEDAGLVVQDCLFICNNILSDSETCQRLFFAMGSDWILRLADFFDPSLLESLETSNFSLGMEDEDEDGPGQNPTEGWFDDPARLACAVLALASLYCSLSTPNKKHQVTLATSTSVVIPSAAFWVARRGPSELVNAGLSLLSRLVEGGNAEIANLLSNSYIKVSPAVPRKNFPADVELPQLVFGWKPLPGDDRKFISILSLLAERYIYPVEAWNPREGAVLGAKLKLRFDVLTEGAENLARSSLLVFEQILAADPSISDLLVQYILAPPPPPHLDGVSQDEDEFGGQQQLESMRPLGLQVLSLLVEGCNKILDGASKSPSFDIAERAANVLSVMFIHGSQLAKELCTAVTITHIGNGMGKPLPLSSHAGSHKSILPLLLFTAGRIARSAGGAGYPLLVSFLRLLACVVSDCEFAAKQVLEDPAILTVVMDLATTTSESAGVPPLVQVAAALFLGCCFEALPSPSACSPPPTNASSDDATLNRKSFLSMLDSRVGLTRITALLKLPVEAPGRGRAPENFSALFITPDLQAFVHKQVEAIRAGIFEFYTAGSESAPGDVLQQKVIEMQNEKIAELEHRLAAYSSGAPVTDVTKVDASAVAELENKLAAVQEELKREQADLAAKATLEISLRDNTSRLEALVEEKAKELAELQTKSVQAEESLQQRIDELTRSLEEARDSTLVLETELATARSAMHTHADEVLSLKQSIVTGHQENKQLKESLEQRDRKIELLMDELRAAQPVDNNLSERKIADLEARNSELKAQVWELESQLKTSEEQHKSALLTLAVPTPSDAMSDVSLVTSPPPAQLFDPSFEVVSNAAIALVRQLGIADELSDFQFVENTLRGTDAEPQRHRLVEELLHQCSESLSNAINECSDIAEQAGIHDLEGDEGSVLRFLDCCHKLRENILDASQHTQDASEIEQLKLQIEFLEQQLNDAEGVIGEKSEQLRVLEDALEESVAETARLQERLSLQDTTTSSSNSEASLFREEFFAEKAALEAQCETFRAQVAAQVAALEAQLSQATEVAAKTEIALQQHAAEDAEGLRTEVTRLHEELEAEKRLISSLQMQLGEAESDAAQVEASLREQINDATNAHQMELTSLQDELGAQQARLDEQASISNQKITALEAELNAVREEIAASIATIAMLREELARAQEIPMHVHSREADELREQLHAQAASHEEHTRHLTHEVEILKSTWREAEEAAVVAASTIESLRNEVTQLKENSSTDAETFAAQVLELNASLAASKEKASAAGQASEDLQIELDGIRKASNQSTEEIRTELERVRHDLIQHEHRLAESSAENEKLKADSAAHLDELQRVLEAKHVEECAQQTREAEQRLSEQKERLEQQLEDAWGEMEILRKVLLQKIEDTAAAQAADKEAWSTEREALLLQVSHAAAQLTSVEQRTQSGASQLTAVRTAAQQEIASLQAQLNAKEFASSAELLENALLRAQINTTEDVLAQLEDGYSAVGTRCAAAESENATLANEREALSQSVEQVQAQLDALHMQYDSETLLLKESYDKQSQLVRQLEAELERVKQETEDELTASDKKYADLLLSLEDLDTKTASQNKIVAVLQEEVADRTAQEETLRAEMTTLQQALDSERAVVAELRATYEASASSLDALQSQAQELRRLSQSVDHLSREVHAKDQQIATLSTQLRRREGEAAGVLTTFESVKADIALLREENERLTDKYVAENKLVQERDRRIRTLQAALEAEQNEMEQLRVKSQTERAAPKHEVSQLAHARTELSKKMESALTEFVAWVITTYKITDYKVTNALQADGTRLLTISTAISAHSVLDSFKLIEVLRNCITWLVEGRDIEIRDKAKSLSDKEQELVNLRRILIAFESSDQQHAEKVLMHTPVRGQAHHNHSHNGASEQHLPDSLHSGTLVSTPESKAPPSSSAYNSSLAMTPSGGKARWSGAKSAIQHASPAAKQAAKLHSEVLKERSKLAALQEQHSDLLGLLAQQDVELSVFREVIQSRLGPSELSSVEDVAKANTIDLYGSYTQFRYDL